MMRRLLLLLEESGISHKHRIKYASLATLVIILIFTLSSYQSITQEEAIALLKQFSELIQGRLTPYGIFLNNFLIALAMVIPVVGVGVAGFIIYQTGLVVSAMSVLSGVPALILVLIPFITFYGIPEMLAYGVAVSESVILTGQIIRGRFRGELKVLPLVIGVILILLVVASLVEYLLLVAIGELAGEMGIEIPV